jgi:hypothetical protein
LIRVGYRRFRLACQPSNKAGRIGCLLDCDMKAAEF